MEDKRSAWVVPHSEHFTRQTRSRRVPEVLWSSFFVTLLAKKIPLFIQLFLPHEALHNYCNYADAHNYIQHMQIPLPLDKVTAPF